jgi:FKBP-type peptidyl-prolyl cis-trans isomerase FkpA
MKFKVLASFAAISLFLIACQSDKQKTPSGFDIIFHNRGEGDLIKSGDWVYFDYIVMVNDSILDQTQEGQPSQRMQIPEQFSKGDNVYFLFEAFNMCKMGDSISLFVPVGDLGGPVPENMQATDVIHYVFKITAVKDDAAYQQDLEQERVEFEKQREEAVKMAAGVQQEVEAFLADYKSGANKSSIQATESGLRYVIVKEGNGDKVAAGNSIDAHYYGVLNTGEMFDNSYMRGTPFNFTIGQGQVIQGWDEGFQLLDVGAKAYLIVPPSLAYGDMDRGTIPPNSELIFLVEVLAKK